MIIEMLKVFFIPFFSIFRAVFSVIHSFEPLKELLSPITNAFSIVNCIIYGILAVLATFLRLIRKHVLKN